MQMLWFEFSKEMHTMSNAYADTIQEQQIAHLQKPKEKRSVGL